MGFDIIKKIYEKKAQEREKSRESVLKELFDVINKLKMDFPFQEAYIFGSVTKPYQFGKSSDIDIAFKGLKRDNLFMVTSFLSSHLERDVNAIHLEDVHFSNKITKEGLKWTKD